jgi:hypothetical protein
MNSSLESQLNRIFNEVVFHSDVEYSIGGLRYPATGFENQLYASCYSREFTLPLDLSFGGADPTDSMQVELSAANTTRESWDYGWQVTQILADGSLYATKQAQSRMLRPGEYMFQDPAAPAQPGAWIRAFLSKEDVLSQPGFYIVQPEIAPSFSDFQSLVRLYWHISPECAPELLHRITVRFNALRVPFQFKTLRYRTQYSRADSAVLFVGWRYTGIALRLASEIHADVRSHMKPYTPLFTKQLLPGLALAEDPGNGQSFGMSRCGLLAQAVVNSWQQGQQSQESRMSILRGLFEKAGFDLDNPHLSLSSVDHYEFQ